LSLHQHGLVACLDQSGFEYPVVPAAAAAAEHRTDQQRLAESRGELPAWLPRLAHFEQYVADPVTVADAHRRLVETGQREVFAHAAGAKAQRRERRRPRDVAIDIIGINRLVGAAVQTLVGLRVAVQSE